MASLRVKDIPTTHAEAKKLLGRNNQRKVSKNGWLVSLDNLYEDDRIVLKLFSTNIVTFYADGRMYLHYGNYPKRTTVTWINKVLKYSNIFSRYVELSGWHSARPNGYKGNRRFGYYTCISYGGGALNVMYELPLMINSLGIPITEGERSNG